LRERLGIGAGEELVAVAQAGLSEEARRLAGEPAAESGPTSRPLRIEVFDLWDQDALFPIAEWLGDADRIFSGAGYNSFWEGHWLGRAARTRFFPFGRKMDDQGWRVSHCAGHRMRENGADTLARLVRSG
jgi:hypothetical protein